ncbi:MAG: HAD family hydrolase [Bacteriovoracaceae bacterium]
MEVRGYIVFDWDGTLAQLQADRQYHLFPGIRELLQTLSVQGYLIYLWTARERYSMTRILEELGVKSFFTEISTPTDCTPKPSPDGLIMMLQTVEKKKVVMIGDSNADIIGAKKFGAWALGAGWNPELNDAVLIEYGADTIVETPMDCLKIIQELLK